MKRKVLPFNRHGNFTAIDNAVFDVIMPSLGSSEWKVLSFILRKTIGWHKMADRISYKQIQEGTGLASPSTVSRALKNLIEENIIVKQAADNPWEADFYGLNVNYSVTEIVVDSATKNVVLPTTEIVDTKERERKYKKENSQSFEVSGVVK